MLREDLKHCLEKVELQKKLALNLIEFLVSMEDCQDKTVYGHGESKKEMLKNLTSVDK